VVATSTDRKRCSLLPDTLLLTVRDQTRTYPEIILGFYGRRSVTSDSHRSHLGEPQQHVPAELLPIANQEGNFDSKRCERLTG
jgi:hypothetical protein